MMLTLAAVLVVPSQEGGVLYREHAAVGAVIVLASLLTLLANRGRLPVGGWTLPAVVLALLIGSTAMPSSEVALEAGRSVDPGATRLGLARLVVGLLAAVTGAALFRRRDSQVILLATVVVAAAGYGVLGLLDRIGPIDLVLRAPLEVLATPFGPFVNPNNAAGLLILGLVAVTGWIGSRSVRAAAVQSAPPRIEGTILIAAGGAVIAAALVATGSRSGVAAGCLGVATTGAVFFIAAARIRGWRIGQIAGRLLGLMGLAGGVGYAATRLIDSRWIAEEWQRRGELSGDARFEHWSQMMQAVAERPWRGWGAETYGQVSRRVCPTERNLWFEHADGQWVEWLVEVGGVGVGLIAVTLGTLLLSHLRSAAGVTRAVRFQSPVSPDEVSATVTRAATATGVLVGLAAHSCFDFAVLAAAVWLPAALMVGFAPASIGRLGSWTGGGLLVAAAVATWDLVGGSRVQSLAIEVPPLRGAYSVDAAELADLIDRAETAAAARPVDALGQWTCARLHRHQAQLQLLSRPPAVLGVPTAMWPQVSPASLHSIACAVDGARLARLRDDAIVADELTAAATFARRCETLAPLRYRAAGLAASLDWIDRPPQRLDRAAALGSRLPVHRPTQQTVARLAWSAGDRDLFAATLARLLRLDAPAEVEWMQPLLREFAVDDIVAMLPDDPAVLIAVAGDWTTAVDDPLRTALVAAAVKRLDAPESIPSAERLVLRSRLDRLAGDVDQAIVRLRDGIEADPQAVEARRDYAELLIDRGELDEAAFQVQIAGQLDQVTARDRALLHRIRKLTQEAVR